MPFIHLNLQKRFRKKRLLEIIFTRRQSTNKHCERPPSTFAAPWFVLSVAPQVSRTPDCKSRLVPTKQEFAFHPPGAISSAWTRERLKNSLALRSRAEVKRIKEKR
jgi:hypothetical protein